MPVSNAPFVEVAECAEGPLLAQVTVSPWSMVIVPGVKLKSAMVTEPLAAATAFGSGVRVPAPSSARNVGSGGAVAGAAGAAGAGSAGAPGAGSAGAGAGSGAAAGAAGSAGA